MTVNDSAEGQDEMRSMSVNGAISTHSRDTSYVGSYKMFYNCTLGNLITYSAEEKTTT